jgi:hypothetical protein
MNGKTMDEFLITATAEGKEPRTWTRSTYAVAKFIADSAVSDRSDYERAEVINTYGGDISDVLYTSLRDGTRIDITKE